MGSLSFIAVLACVGHDGHDESTPITPHDDSAGEIACEATTPSMVIGTGEYAWVDLAAGDPLTMVHGPQGGWHMLASVRLMGFYQNIQLRYTITDMPSGQLISDNQYFVQQVATGPCAGEVIGRYGYLNLYDDLIEGEKDTPWELFACHDMTLEMTVSDPTWKIEGNATLEVVAVPDPADASGVCP